MNLIKTLVISFLIFSVSILPGRAFATFNMSLTSGYNTMDFGGMRIGEEKMLSDKGGYQHEFTFTSTNARTWRLKAQLLRPFTSGTSSIAPENFKWIVEELQNSQGYLANSISTENPFSTFPILIYTSANSDNTGTQVRMKFRYKLKIPKSQAAGAYTAQVRFIMVEDL